MSEITTSMPPEVAEPEREQLSTLDDEEHYVVEKTCTQCEKRFTTSLLKNKFKSRQEAVKSVENRTACGACLNKDKIQKAAEQMRDKM